MPIYEYHDTNSGRTVELVKPVDERDDVPAHLKRITVPKRVGALFGAIRPTDADAAVPKAFKDLECTIPGGYREIERQSGFSAEHIKKTCGL